MLVDRVVGDRALHQRLLAHREREQFIAAAIDIATELHLDVTTADVEAALRDALEWWLARWV